MKQLYTVLAIVVWVGSAQLSFGQAETQNPTLPFWKTKGNTGTTPPSVSIGSAVDNNFIGTLDNADFTVVTNNVERLRFDASRYMIGIGEQDPQYAIDLKINPDAIFPCTYNGIRINHPSLNNSCNNGIFWGLDNGQLPGEAGALWQYLNTGYIKFGIGTVAAGEKMRLTRNGLGINVTSPATQLHITENTGLRNGLMVSQPTTPNADGTLFGLDISSIQGRDAMIWNYIANGEMKFGTQNAERVRIDANGKVGIATATPAQLLHVSGTGNTVRVDGVSAAGTFSTAPAASTDRLLYADVNGDVKALPQGSSGQILGLNASGVPEWIAQADTGKEWKLLGNSGTIDGTNFIGTTDNVPLNIKINNQRAGRVSSTYTTLGYLAGNASTTNLHVAVGDSALFASTATYPNTAVGHSALRKATTGWANTAIGSYSGSEITTAANNTALGNASLQNATTQNNTTAIGNGALQKLVSGVGNNVAIGSAAMNGSVSSIHTTAVGFEAMEFDSTGDMNVAMGWRALRNHKTGNENTAIGVGAMEASVNSASSTAVGRGSLFNIKANLNTGVGYYSGALSDSAVATTMIGAYAGYYNEGDYNTYVGYYAGVGNSSVGSRTGDENTAVGALTLRFINIGKANIALGHGAMYYGYTGRGNIGIGVRALHGLNTGVVGNHNVALGDSAAFQMTSGNRNISIGAHAAQTASNVSDIIAIGDSALFVSNASENFAIGNKAGMNTTNFRNFFIGNSAGLDNTSGSYNFYIGAFAGESNTTGSTNMAIGRAALQNSQTSNNNTAIGRLSGQHHFSGDENLYVGLWSGIYDSIGAYNTYLGSYAGQGIATNKAYNVYYNTGVGFAALANSVTGGYNVAVGVQALRLNTTGTGNVAAGVNALYNHVKNGNNTALGFESMFDDTSGYNNSAIGWRSLRQNYTGYDNVALGVGALEYGRALIQNTAVGRWAMGNSEGDYNTAIGAYAGLNSNNANYATMVGMNAGQNNEGAENIFVGYNSGYGALGDITGVGNTAVGSQSLYTTTSGANNTSIGIRTLDANTTGSENVAVGSDALTTNIAGGGNVAIGHSALYSTTAGQNTAVGHYSLTNTSSGNLNTAVGAGSMDYNTTGANNSAVGFWALRGSFPATGRDNTAMGYTTMGAISTGYSNSAFGSYAGKTITTGSRNTMLGDSADVTSSSINRSVAIGYNAKVSASSAMVLGGTGVDTVSVGIGVTNPSFTLHAVGNRASVGWFVNVNGSLSDNYGIYASTNNVANYGYGGYFEGGYMGARGNATQTGSGTRFGLYGNGRNGTSTNYGVYGVGFGGSVSYGLYGFASGGSTLNYGVYGTSSGGTAWAGYFNGAVFGTSYTTSDRKLKNNIQPLRNSMEIINRLRPTTYYYKTEEYKQLHLSEGLQYGLIADEVQEVIPSAIKRAVTPAIYENGDEKHGKKLSDAVEFNAMNYTEIIPILVGGMQEQQKEIEALKKQNETLLKLLEELKNK